MQDIDDSLRVLIGSIGGAMITAVIATTLFILGANFFVALGGGFCGGVGLGSLYIQISRKG